MKKWWKRNKNRIFSLAFAVLIATSSFVVSSLEARASEDFVDDAEIDGVWSDKNSDGNMDVDEVNYARMLAFVFMRAGYWVDTASDNFADAVEQAKVLFSGSSDTILGYLGSDGAVELNEDAWNMFLSIADYLEKNDGYTVYPAFSASPYYYINNGQTGNDTYINNFVNNFGSMIENNAFVYKDSYGSFKIYLPKKSLSSTSYPYSPERNDYVYVRFNNGNYLYIYYFNENGALTPAGYYGSRYFLSPSENSGWYWNSYSGSTQYFGCSSTFLGFVGNSHPVFDSVAAAYKYYSYDRDVYRHSHGGAGGSFALDDLNNTDWVGVQGDAYSYLNNGLVENAGNDDFDAQTFIDEFSEQVLSDLGNISQEQVNQTGILHKILELLKKHLPKIGSSGGDTNINVDLDGETEQPSVDKFGSDSSEQSSSLSDLNEQTQVDKPNVDDMSSQIDENLDIEIDSNYGSVLASLTSNSNILTMLIVSVSVALISYILFGKK